MKIIKRVKQIMKQNGMDTNNEMLVLDFSIVYLKAQQDLLKQQLEEVKDDAEAEELSSSVANLIDFEDKIDEITR